MSKKVSFWNDEAELMVISEKALSRAPEAMRAHVRKFFQRNTIFENDCWIAIRTTGFVMRSKNENEGNTAPCRALVVTQFVKDLSGEKMREVIAGLEKDPTQCFCLCSVNGNEGCVGIIEE